MNIQELRLGNYLQDAHGSILIADLSNFGNIQFWQNVADDKIKPIQLTKDCLVNFGFVEKYPLGEDFTVEEYTYRIFVKDSFEIEFNFSDGSFALQNLTGIPLIEYKYFHTLQNIYHILTGKDLTV